ncbi:MAG: choice-of-anchor D domain-containing protein [Candidatus Schekmanbacteria bacterium]|nr:choice-of-anchor D domain-containing protein [Candidatus Schekmanbacteria bacterium]
MKSRCIVLAVFLMSIFSSSVFAQSNYVTTWQTRYPSSQSVNNVNTALGSKCRFCHFTSSTSTWNAYGWALRLEINNNGKTISQALAAVESLNSDGDPTNSSNLVEINANAQPGWTSGANNTRYNTSSTVLNQTAPAISNLDPAAATQPAINVSPASLAFGSGVVGVTKTLAATISNSGNANLSVTGLSITGSSDFKLNSSVPATPLTVAPSASVNISVDFTPSSTGAKVGTFQIASSDPSKATVSVNLSGTGDPVPQPDINVLPVSLGFGTEVVGATKTLTTTINNIGNASLTVTGLSITGSSDFKLNSSAPAVSFTVAANASVDVAVDFIPSSTGAKVATLQIASSDPDEATVSVNLSGTGSPVLQPDINVLPVSLGFGTEVVGATKTLTTTINNIGNTDLTVTGLSISGSSDFKLNSSAPVVSFTVAANASVDVAVDFIPSSTGAKVATLQIASSDPDEATVSVNLSGTGSSMTQPDINVLPVSLGFGTEVIGATKTLTATISNVGNADLTVTGLSISGSSDFKLNSSAPAVSFTVAANNSVEIAVDYTPSSAAASSATLQIASSDPDEATVSVNLSGTGSSVAQPDINVLPAALDFGTEVVGTTKTLTAAISNIGNADLTVTGLSISGSSDFSLNSSTPSVSFTVAANNSVEIAVDFTPSSAAASSATLQIASSDPDEATVSVNLSGTGTDTTIQSVDYDVKEFSVTKSVKLKEGKSIKIKLVAENNGTTNEPRNATVKGIQNNAEIYNQTISISVDPANSDDGDDDDDDDNNNGGGSNGHTVNEDGVYHRPGLKDPMTNCTECHGSDLKGGDVGVSCYSCHDAKWSESGNGDGNNTGGSNGHTVNKDGVYHRPGLNDPMTNCTECHGSDLKGGSVGVSCYSCHGAKWSENGDDDESDKQALTANKTTSSSEEDNDEEEANVETFEFPDYTAIASGDITWTITIDDDDSDLDEASATTKVSGQKSSVVEVKPSKVSIKAGKKKELAANIKTKSSKKKSATTSQKFDWYVNDVLGGNSEVGTITPVKKGGKAKYAAPTKLTGSNKITIKAVSKSDSSLYGTSQVTIQK